MPTAAEFAADRATAKTFFQGDDSNPLKNLQRIKFKNNNASQVPAFGIMRITDFTVDAEESYLVCDQPNTYGAQENTHAINLTRPVNSGKFGYCTLASGLVQALYDNSDGTPAFGEMWGPRSGTWKLKKNTGGFRIFKTVNSTSFLAAIKSESFRRFRGTANADILAGFSGTASIFYRSGALAYTDTTVDTPSNSVINDLDGTVKSGAVIDCVYDPYMSGSTYTESWRIIQSSFTC